MRRVVIGVGNPDRGDDGAGIEVARRVRGVDAFQDATGSYRLIDLWEGAAEVIVVDAARSGAPAGTVHRFQEPDRPLSPGVLSSSTHSIGVQDTVELARTLGRLPERITVYGIEVADVTQGHGLSPPVEDAVRRLVEEIEDA
ncbi:MAG TPA: hydrogenase maturation protease [Acidimicrobiia bacterium]|jgi:hydrogenase maturation protease